MNALDVLIVLAIVGVSVYGYTRGIVILVAGALGLVAGLVVGFVLAPYVVDWLGAGDPRGRQLTVLVVVAASVGLGSAIAGLVITPFWVQLVGRSRDTRALDSVLGAAAAGVVALCIAWLFTVSFDRGPNVELARLIQQSRILRKLESVAPTPPTLVIRVEQLLASQFGPSLFIGLEPELPTTVSPSSIDTDTPAIRAAAASVVKVSGPGCGGVVTGSGFVVAENLVLTNAHVVAGVRSLTVITSDGRRQAATLRIFDPERDVAVLAVSGLSAAPISVGSAERGMPGAVIGYPGGGPERVVPAVVTGTITATGRDIFGDGAVSRQIVVTKADVRPGNSGGPLVDGNGHAVGLIYASSVSQPDHAFALAPDEFGRDLQVANDGGTSIDARVKQCAQ
jgi:S1-C subfamily serine protease